MLAGTQKKRALEEQRAIWLAFAANPQAPYKNVLCGGVWLSFTDAPFINKEKRNLDVHSLSTKQKKTTKMSNFIRIEDKGRYDSWWNRLPMKTKVKTSSESRSHTHTHSHKNEISLEKKMAA